MRLLEPGHGGRTEAWRSLGVDCRWWFVQLCCSLRMHALELPPELTSVLKPVKARHTRLAKRAALSLARDSADTVISILQPAQGSCNGS